MQYNFDERIDRRGTNSVKWEYIQSEADPTRPEHTNIFFEDDPYLPMWVADMDFRVAQPIIDALTARVQHGLFGYSLPSDSYFEATINWMQRRHNWKIERDWIVPSPSVVPSLALMFRALLTPGDRVMVLTPVYYPFYKMIEVNGGDICRVPMIYKDNTYTLDFDAIERETRDPRVRFIILCNPHNPVGRAWTEPELRRLGEICLANEVLVIADEVHGDLIMRGHTFTPYATLGDEFQQRSITCTAPSKSFNLAGMATSNTIIPDPDLRARYQTVMGNSAIHGASMFGMVALEAAYNHGEEWLEQALDYISDNAELVTGYLAENIPQIKLVPLEGTYLAWLDCRALGLDVAALRELIYKDAHVYLDEGIIFGPEGEGFERINLACPRSIVSQALSRIRDSIARLETQRAAGK